MYENLRRSGRDDGTGTLGARAAWKLAVGLVGNFALGALMTLGIGIYAPCMILIGLLGMNASTAFPIMMGSCAFLMPISSARFVQKRAYALPSGARPRARRHARRAHRRLHRQDRCRSIA